MFEGVHGLFHGFAHTAAGDYGALDDFGERWVIETLAFKPYPCGTMAHPYIDCARRLAARGIKPDDVKELVCEVAEGTVHRLWEPLAAKQRPPNGYAAKFATPFILATGFVRGGVGLDAFTDEAVRDPAVLALAAKVRYVIDPDNPYPNAFTGHIRAVLNDGGVVEERQPHFRGGAQEPLTRADLEEKFGSMCAMAAGTTRAPRRRSRLLTRLYDGKIDLREDLRDMSEARNSPARSRSSPAPGAISGAPSRWRWRKPARRWWSTCARTRRKPTAWCARSRPPAARPPPMSATSPIRRPPRRLAALALDAIQAHRHPGQQRGAARREADRRR